jgi:C-terminal processing protease CtpA/Prc
LDDDSTRDSGFDVNWKSRKAQSEFRYARPRSCELGDVIVWEQPTFTNGVGMMVAPTEALPPLGVTAQSILEKSRKNRELILDLRGNHGGQFTGLQWLLGRTFDHEVLTCDVMSRGNRDPESAKSVGKYACSGMLTVLVDSEANSEAEVFARVVQLEKRGVVIGDQTSARMGLQMVRTGAVIMKDGKNPDGTGVAPDLKLLPRPEDLAAGRRPALSTAISLAGNKIDRKQAGEILTRN